MHYDQGEQLIKAINEITRGKIYGDPVGFEALTLALGGHGRPGREDSVAAGLHDIAGAIRELAETIQSKQTRNNRRRLL